MNIRNALLLTLSLFYFTPALNAQDSPPDRRIINLPRGQGAALPFSDAVMVGNTLYVSGRGGIDFTTMKVPEDPKEEARLLLDGYKSILAEAGMTMDDLVSVTVYCPDLSLYPVFNEVYRSYFTKDFPARAFVGSGPLLFGLRFEMQGIATTAQEREQATGGIEDPAKLAELFAKAQYPYVRGSEWSGILPVDNPSEIPDPAREYKLLFEITEKNPDEHAGEINYSLDEVTRILNLHVASGIPPAKIRPVIIVHGPGIELATNDAAYRKRHSVENPNTKLIHDLENAGARFIVCGQAMAIFDTPKEELMPDMNISLTTQTALSNYQLQGFVLYPIKPDR